MNCWMIITKFLVDFQGFLSKTLFTILWVMRLYIVWVKEAQSRTEKQLSVCLATRWRVGLLAS